MENRASRERTKDGMRKESWWYVDKRRFGIYRTWNSSPPNTKEVRPGWGQQAEGVGLPMAFIFFLSMKCRNITSQTTLFNFSSYPILFPVCLQILFTSALLGLSVTPSLLWISLQPLGLQLAYRVTMASCLGLSCSLIPRQQNLPSYETRNSRLLSDFPKY